MPLVFFVDRFLVPKEGSSRTECEDAIRVVPDAWPEDALARPICAAVSDGASESLLSGRWSQVLVDQAVNVVGNDPQAYADPHTLAAELVRLAVAPWDDQIKKYIADRQADGRPVQWYEQPGLDKGAFATLVAVSLHRLPEHDAAPDEDDDRTEQLPGPEWEFQAVALGDSCLFHISQGELTSFPITTSEEFGLNPQLLGSRNHDVGLIADRLARTRGTLRDGDEILLATDALAAWLLRGHEEGGEPWLALGAVADGGWAAFEPWVREQRATRLMRNDDVALVRIQVRTEGAR